MNYMKTALLLAALTAFFLAIGYLLGGRGGLMIALVVALGMNFFAYWNSDKMVLRMANAREVGPNEAPELYGIVQQLAQPTQLVHHRGALRLAPRLGARRPVLRDDLGMLQHLLQRLAGRLREVEARLEGAAAEQGIHPGARLGAGTGFRAQAAIHAGGAAIELGEGWGGFNAS